MINRVEAILILSVSFFYKDMEKDLFMGNCQLMFGDCLERMKEIGDKSIDMILCDLP